MQSPHVHKLDAIYVVVADHASARFFTAATPTAPLVEHTALENPSENLREGQLVSDRADRANSYSGHGGSTIGETHTKEHLAERFAKAVCEELKAARVAGRCERIHLIAERDFLGMLRAHLDPPTARLVASEIGKEVVHLGAEQIRRLLPDSL